MISRQIIINLSDEAELLTVNEPSEKIWMQYSNEQIKVKIFASATGEFNYTKEQVSQICDRILFNYIWEENDHNGYTGLDARLIDASALIQGIENPKNYLENSK